MEICLLYLVGLTAISFLTTIFLTEPSEKSPLSSERQSSDLSITIKHPPTKVIPISQARQSKFRSEPS